MVAYFTSLLGASITVALVNLLAPNGSAKIIRLISSLFLIVVLAAPLPSVFQKLGSAQDHLDDLLQDSDPNDSYTEQMQEALNSASRAYFAQALTQMLEQRFQIPTGELRCIIQWSQEDTATPERITVVLSGSAKWKDPAPIEDFVSGLIGCDCVSAIE